MGFNLGKTAVALQSQQVLPVWNLRLKLLLQIFELCHTLQSLVVDSDLGLNVCGTDSYQLSLFRTMLTDFQVFLSLSSLERW